MRTPREEGCSVAGKLRKACPVVASAPHGHGSTCDRITTAIENARADAWWACACETSGLMDPEIDEAMDDVAARLGISEETRARKYAERNG